MKDEKLKTIDDGALEAVSGGSHGHGFLSASVDLVENLVGGTIKSISEFWGTVGQGISDRHSSGGKNSSSSSSGGGKGSDNCGC